MQEATRRGKTRIDQCGRFGQHVERIALAECARILSAREDDECVCIEVFRRIERRAGGIDAIDPSAVARVAEIAAH